MNNAAFNLAASIFTGNNARNEASNDAGTEIYILGVRYTTPHDNCAVTDDVVSRFWFTYRKDFAPIGSPAGPTNDTGWGCMMRCGQMMLAEAYVRFFTPAGRYFRWRASLTDATYWEILRMFTDKRHSSYSIHQIVQMGNSEGKSIGQWFGPNTIAQVLRRIASNEFEKQINVHVAMDNTLILSDIRKLYQSSPKLHSIGNESSNSWKPLVIIVPLRLGLHSVNVEYVEQLKVCFQFPQTLGCIGGKPNHAHYFIGYAEKDELLYLDPHVTQAHVDTTKSNADSSYHCDQAQRMKFSALDPSLALAFACKTEHEFDDLIEKLRLSFTFKPIFEICESNQFDNLSETIAHHDIVCLDSDDDFELV